MNLKDFTPVEQEVSFDLPILVKNELNFGAAALVSLINFCIITVLDGGVRIEYVESKAHKGTFSKPLNLDHSLRWLRKEKHLR